MVYHRPSKEHKAALHWSFEDRKYVRLLKLSQIVLAWQLIVSVWGAWIHFCSQKLYRVQLFVLSLFILTLKTNFFMTSVCERLILKSKLLQNSAKCRIIIWPLISTNHHKILLSKWSDFYYSRQPWLMILVK